LGVLNLEKDSTRICEQGLELEECKVGSCQSGPLANSSIFYLCKLMFPMAMGN